MSLVTNMTRKEIAALYRSIKKSDFERNLERKRQQLSHTEVGVRGLLTTANTRFLYVLVRCIKPEVVVETGVCNGMSTAYLLQGLHDNHCGHLYSIDLPNHPTLGTDLILPDGYETGELIPEYLRGSWDLITGDATYCLGPLLSKVKTIDIFIHDSRHTYEHMMWEYVTAWPSIKKGGFLVSDDIHWNNAFSEFLRNVQCSTYHTSQGQGVLKKD